MMIELTDEKDQYGQPLVRIRAELCRVPFEVTGKTEAIAIANFNSGVGGFITSLHTAHQAALEALRGGNIIYSDPKDDGQTVFPEVQNTDRISIGDDCELDLGSF